MLNDKDLITTIGGHFPQPEQEQPAVHYDRRFYPPDIAHDLDNVELPAKMKDEILATAWEYSRSVIPNWTNWNRYVAFMRIIVMGITAEFLGELVDIVSGDAILDYNLDVVLAALFGGTPDHEAMAREYRSFLLFSSEKTSNRRDGELFHRYVNALAQSPHQWFRMRDSDALARFTIATALACNDFDSVSFTDAQYDILAEIGDTMYDAVAFFKHRSEGETNSTFAYVPADYRIIAYRECREILWALDVAWRDRPECQCVMAFLRVFGGPLQLMMRRYRFVEEDLTLGRPETEQVKNQTRRHFKLWNRIDASATNGSDQTESRSHYHRVQDQKDKLLFPGLAEFLERSEVPSCPQCQSRDVYGADTHHIFGGVQLCGECRESWRSYSKSLIARSIKAFPELADHIQPTVTQPAHMVNGKMDVKMKRTMQIV